MFAHIESLHDWLEDPDNPFVLFWMTIAFCMTLPDAADALDAQDIDSAFLLNPADAWNIRKIIQAYDHTALGPIVEKVYSLGKLLAVVRQSALDSKDFDLLQRTTTAWNLFYELEEVAQGVIVLSTTPWTRMAYYMDPQGWTDPTTGVNGFYPKEALITMRKM